MLAEIGHKHVVLNKAYIPLISGTTMKMAKLLSRQKDRKHYFKLISIAPVSKNSNGFTLHYFMDLQPIELGK